MKLNHTQSDLAHFAPYSYRTDPEVPDFDDSRPLFVFDTVCVLCSGAASTVLKHDTEGRIALTSAQGPIGQGLYRHYGLELDDSFLFLRDGRVHTLSDGVIELGRELGGVWSLGRVGRVIPRPLRDWAYRIVARNRYKWFGKTEQACALLTEEQRARLI